MKPLFLGPAQFSVRFAPRMVARVGCLIVLLGALLYECGLDFYSVARAEIRIAGHASHIGPLQAGVPAPAFSLPDVEGKLRSLKEWAGRRVALCFFCGCEP